MNMFKRLENMQQQKTQKLVVVCAKIEEELSGLEDEEKTEMLEEYGLANQD